MDGLDLVDQELVASRILDLIDEAASEEDLIAKVQAASPKWIQDISSQT